MAFPDVIQTIVVRVGSEMDADVHCAGVWILGLQGGVMVQAGGGGSAAAVIDQGRGGGASRAPRLIYRGAYP